MSTVPATVPELGTVWVQTLQGPCLGCISAEEEQSSQNPPGWAAGKNPLMSKVELASQGKAVGKKSSWEFSKAINLLDVSGNAKPKYFLREEEFFLPFPGTSLHRASRGEDVTERAELRQSLSLLLGPQAKFQCGRCPSLCCPVKGSRDLLCASQCFLPNVFYSFSKKPLSLPVQVTLASINEDLSWHNRKISPRAERNAQKM